MKIFVISGARPQFIKLAPIINEIKKNNEIELFHLHTGQHYDSNMSDVFFKELNIPSPNINLGINSSSHAELVGKMMIKIEKHIIKENPDVVLVPGDTDSTLAGALAASKLQYPVVHLESGLRSYDYRMPEEINRKVTDHVSRMLITTSKTATENLRKEGIKSSWIFETGDTMVDAILNNIERANKNSNILSKLKLTPKKYVLLTLHRKENVDNKQRLKNILEGLQEIDYPIVYPIHPRTKKRIKEYSLDYLLNNENIIKIEPTGYLNFIALEYNAAIILTDSGGIQKEAFTLKIPCITLRDNTEWVETIELGANFLVGADKERFLQTVNKVQSEIINNKSFNWKNPYGDGKSSMKIVNEILKRFHDGELDTEINIMK